MNIISYCRVNVSMDHLDNVKREFNPLPMFNETIKKFVLLNIFDSKACWVDL